MTTNVISGFELPDDKIEENKRFNWTLRKTGRHTLTIWNYAERYFREEEPYPQIKSPINRTIKKSN